MFFSPPLVELPWAYLAGRCEWLILSLNKMQTEAHTHMYKHQTSSSQGKQSVSTFSLNKQQKLDAFLTLSWRHLKRVGWRDISRCIGDMKKEEKENDQDLTEDVTVFEGKKAQTRLRYRKIRYGVLKGIQRQRDLYSGSTAHTCTVYCVV